MVEMGSSIISLYLLTGVTLLILGGMTSSGMMFGAGGAMVMATFWMVGHRED